jgi:hypothetical protein
MTMRLTILLLCLLPLCGCQAAVNYAENKALGYAETKVTEITGEHYDKLVDLAVKNGFTVVDLDPNMDGQIDLGEQWNWQIKFQRHQITEAGKEFARTGDLKAAQDRLWDGQDIALLSGAITAVGGVAVNALRNRTRKKALDKVKAGS